MVISILLSLFSLFLVGFVFYASQFDNVKHSDHRFNNIVKVFISLILIHCIAIYLNLGLPIALLYGPIHLSLHRISQQKITKGYLSIHLLPFLLMSVFYCVLYYFTQSESVFAASLSLYYPVLFFAMTVSSVAYGSYIWSTQKINFCQKQQQLVLQLASIAIVISIFLSIFFLTQISDLNQDGIGFNPFYIIYGLLLMLVFLMVFYLLTEKNSGISDMVRSVNFENPKYQAFSIETNVLKEYSSRLDKVVDEKKLYLHSGISLEELQTETGIPKHHLSQLFNNYLGKTFYYYIAEKRIKEAISRLEDDDNITLESLAFECGFNSKTSFNRYFKEITNVTPSEYRTKSVDVKSDE